MTSEKIKQVVVCRKDVKMTKGKLAVQVAHASVIAVLEAKKRKSKYLKEWLTQGMPKILLKAKDLNELKNIAKELEKKGIDVFFVADAGKTQLSPGTITCFATMPLPEKKLDEITKKLKLF